MKSTTATFKSLDEFHAELEAMGSYSAEYWSKQVHLVPKSSTVNRNEFLVKLCTGKTVLHVGCTGLLDEQLRKVATKCYGVNDEPIPGRPDHIVLDLDKSCSLGLGTWSYEDVDLIVCGEVLEHLSNPGNFLDALKLNYPSIPVAITVPNAMCSAGADWLLKRGRENVHRDHVSYYSYTTLKTLLQRAGYVLTANYWYGGKPYVAEGIIALARPE